MSESWKVTLPCTRAEAEAITDDMGGLADLVTPPVLMTSEVVADDPLQWQVEAYFEGKPSAKVLKIFQTLIPSAHGAKPRLEQLPDEDWVTLSQQGMEPVQAGRFFIRNRIEDAVPPGLHGLLIPAGPAFGTGQHETTSGCVAMLDACARAGMHFRNIADIGTGSGVLALVAKQLWRSAALLASDIDPASVRVTRDNAALNGVVTGSAPRQLTVVPSAGMAHPLIGHRAPYDLIVANILAGPLIELAPSICAHLEDGGTLILAGLLDTQTDRVLQAYRRQGLRLAQRTENGQWPTLRLRKRPTIGWRRPRRWHADDVGEAPGFGSW